MDKEEFKILKQDINEIKLDLREHMRRTDIAEKRLDTQEGTIASVAGRLVPLERAQWLWGVIGKALVTIFTGGALAFLSIIIKAVFFK